VAKVSGGSVLCLRTFLERTYGEQAFERVLADLPPPEANELRGIVLPVNWYPAQAFVGALFKAHDVFGEDDVFERYGAFAAEFEINAFQKILLRYTTPMYLIDRASRLWHRFHDTGEWRVEAGKNRIRGTLRGFAVVDSRYCRVIVAWLRRAGEMTGARGDVLHPECRSRGAPACVFTGWWD
jgi:hypothetical protein